MTSNPASNSATSEIVRALGNMLDEIAAIARNQGCTLDATLYVPDGADMLPVLDRSSEWEAA